MKRQEAITVLTIHQKSLKDFGVSSLLLVGSVARDEARPDSDVDLVTKRQRLEFDSPPPLKVLMQ